LNPKLLLIILLTVCIQSYSQLHLDSLLNKIDQQKWSAADEKKIRKPEGKIIANKEKGSIQSAKQKQDKLMWLGSSFDKTVKQLLIKN